MILHGIVTWRKCVCDKLKFYGKHLVNFSGFFWYLGAHSDLMFCVTFLPASQLAAIEHNKRHS